MSGGDPVSVIVHAEYESLYDQVVQPDHIIGVPRYFVRHIPFLGADLAWMYLAFRQAAYEVGARKYGATGRFSGRQIASWSGIVPRTFWNRAAKTETWQKLDGLVRPIRTEEIEWQEDSGTLLQEPNQYTVSMTLPLTAPDAAALRVWLMLKADEHSIDLALKLAADTRLGDLFSADTYDEMRGTQTVFALTEELFGNEIPAPSLSVLATRLHRHIMGHRLEITQFFVKNVLQFLGTGPGMMWVLLRDRAAGQGIVRVQGGYAEAASWLGLNRPKTVWEWFNAKITEERQKSRKESTGKYRTGGREASPIGTLRNPILPFYVREVSQGRAAGGNFDANVRVFEVSAEDIPAELMAFPFDENVSPETLEKWLLSEKLLARFAHPVGAVCTPLLARFAYLIGAVCTVLNNQLTPPQSFADAKEKTADAEEPISPYPTDLNEALTHPDIQFYQSMTGCYPEQKDWVLTIDYITQLRQRHSGLSEAELAKAGVKYFTEWASRNYQHANPVWMHWWLNSNIPPRKARRTRQPKQAQSPRPAPPPVQTEPEPEVDPEDTMKRLAASRKYLEDKGILKPATN